MTLRNVMLACLILLSGCRLFGGTGSGTTPDDDVANQNNANDMGTSGDDGTTTPDMGPDLVVNTNQPQLPTPDVDDRVTDGLLLLMEFKEGTGTTTADTIDPNFQMIFGPTVEWIPGRNGVRLDGPGVLSSQTAHAPFYEHATENERFSVELWIDPANNVQEGPARIFTISPNSSEANFTFGQEAGRYAVRIRQTVPATFGADIGYPMVFSPFDSLQLQETHIVVTFDGINIRMFENGSEVSNGFRAGSLGNWSPSFRLAIGNEFNAMRAWAGDVFLAAIYDRALSDQEVLRNFNAGSVR